MPWRTSLNRASGAAGHAGEVVVERQMGISHSDFYRILPRIIEGVTITELPAGARLDFADGRALEITLSAEKTRTIALLRVVYIELYFRFTGFDQTGCAGFMARFSRAFHKGGG